MIPQHRSKTNEHYTPTDIVERVRRLLGHFDLDPASCAEANETVKAEQIWTKADDGLSKPWYGNVFLNPPGGNLKKVGDRWIQATAETKGTKGRRLSSMQVWWERLTERWRTGDVPQAFFVAFTLELLRTSQAGAFPVQRFPRCYPKNRLRFGGNSPTHANVLIWLPPKTADRAGTVASLMRAQFGDVGLCEGGA